MRIKGKGATTPHQIVFYYKNVFREDIWQNIPLIEAETLLHCKQANGSNGVLVYVVFTFVSRLINLC